MLYRVEGIVIRSMDYGESNKIVTLLTQSHGKVGVLVRGAKKVRSKHSSLAQLFTHGDFSFFKSSGLGTLNHGEIINSHHKLREHLDLSAHAAYIAELTDRSLQENESGQLHFEQLKACLEALNGEKDMGIVTNIYEMKILALSGYAPQLEHCANCGRTASRYFFSAGLGGVICPVCQSVDRYALQVSEAAHKLLRVFAQLDMRRLGSIQVKDDTKIELNHCIRALIDAQLGLQLKSRNFLEQLAKLN